MKTHELILTLLLVVAAIVLLFFVVENLPTYSEEKVEFETLVIQCEKGTLYPDSSYQSLANTSLALGDVASYSTYMALANANGTYDYKITINIDGNDYVVVRSEEYEVGTSILVTRVDTYENSILCKTEYK